MIKKEIWKDVVGYEGFYKISSLGRVSSIDRIIYKTDGTIQTLKGKIIKTYISSNGYISCTICKNGKCIMKNIHSLLILSFLDKEYLNKKLCVNHKDGNKLNNNFSNLEIVSNSNNMQHAIDMNLRNPHKRKNNKLSEKDVLNIKEKLKNYKKGMLKEISIEYNISQPYVSQIFNNIRCSRLKTL